MIFEPTPLEGAFVVKIEPKEDDRGLLARTFCAREFEEHRLVSSFVQCNISINIHCGTVRGMHFQKAPKPETKLVRCTKGRIFDVIVDLRPSSPTFLQWLGFELSEKNHQALYIPAGFAHGFQTLEDNTEIFYQMSEYFDPGLIGGVRYDDPLIRIRFPDAISNISEKDTAWPIIDIKEFKKSAPAGC